MNIEDVKNFPKREKRICRANIRLYPSQMKFIEDNNLSTQAIFDKALDELGHIIPKPEEIQDIANVYGYNKSKGHGRRGKGNIQAQRIRYRKKHFH
jgi:hypothetical protein